MKRHNGQHTVIVVPKAPTEKVLSEVHGNILFGHEGQYKPKNGSFNPTGGQAWMNKSINTKGNVTNVKEQKKTFDQLQTYHTFQCQIKGSTWICLDHSRHQEVVKST
jgi:hypothetical protein